MIVELNATAVQVEVSTFSLLRKTKPWGNCCFQGPGGWRCSWVSRILTTCAVLVWSKQHIPVTLTSGVWGSRVRSSRSPSHKWSSYTGRSRPVRDTRDPVWKTNQPHNKSKSRLLKWKGFALTLGASEYLLPVGFYIMEGQITSCLWSLPGKVESPRCHSSAEVLSSESLLDCSNFLREQIQWYFHSRGLAAHSFLAHLTPQVIWTVWKSHDCDKKFKKTEHLMFRWSW